MAMGLLDDLKKQADLVKTQQILQQNLQGDKLKLVEDKMKQAFQYVHELLKQLAVLKPTSPLVYSIPGVADFRNLVFGESFIDYRKKRINDKEYFDTMHFFVKWVGPDTVVIEKDMPPPMQRIRESLWLSKVKFVEEEKKSARGFVIGAKFIVPTAVLTDIVIKADHEQGRLQIQATHLFGLGVEYFSIPGQEVSDDMLEDFAKALIGQQSEIRKYRVAGACPEPRCRSAATAPDRRLATWYGEFASMISSQRWGQRLAMRPSIHSSTDRFSDSGVWARESIAGPTSTVTVPGRLRKALRPQNRPALCATGTTDAPHFTASHAPPS